MDHETADYIITHFGRHMTRNESIAKTHHIYSQKELAFKSPKITELFIERGLLSRDPTILHLLEQGYEEFAKNTAKRILEENGDEIFLNKCAKCDRLARTPKSK